MLTEKQINDAYEIMAGRADPQGKRMEEIAAEAFRDLHLKIHRIAKALNVIGGK